MLRNAFLVFYIFCASVAFTAELKTTSLNGSIGVTSWKALRDFRVVKQEFDYSCGAASVATLLNGFYGLDVTEADILGSIEKDAAASFENLAKAVIPYGFKSGGLVVSFDDLKKLSIPVIAYLNYKGQDHFTVLRGVSKQGNVAIGDPSWGNRRFRPHQFKKLWETVDNNGTPQGKILLIIPQNVQTTFMDKTFYSDKISFDKLTQFIPLSPF